jgi:hypothetical protein
LIGRVFICLPTATNSFAKLCDKSDAMARKDPAAVALGRRGGQARAKNMSAKERQEAARKAVEARWARTKKKIDSLTEQTQTLERKAKMNSEAREVKQKKTNPPQ